MLIKNDFKNPLLAAHHLSTAHEHIKAAHRILTELGSKVTFYDLLYWMKEVEEAHERGENYESGTDGLPH